MDDHYLSDEDSYLKEVDFNKLFEEARNKAKQEKEARRKQLEGLGIPQNQIEAMLSGLEKEITEESSLEIDELLISKRPEDVRRRTREFLFKNANETATALLLEYGIPEKGNELVPVFNRFFNGGLTASDKNNGIIVRFINSKLSRKFGPVKSREPETLLASKEYAQNQVVPEIRRLLDNVR